MKLRKVAGGLAVAGALSLFATAVPAWAATPPTLPWTSPAMIHSGVPVHVASIISCPPVPTTGDTVLVQVNLSFGPGGAAGEILSANPDGSWSGDVTFYFGGVNLRQTTISAECLDYGQGTAVSYAQYQDHHTQIFD